MSTFLVVIPTLNPSREFISYVEELIQAGFDHILAVNDGSRVEFDAVFEEISQYEEVRILNHAVNMGKGRTIKNSINFFLNLQNKDEYVGVLTVDSDGQHTVSDVVKLRDAMLTRERKLFFGSRDFNEEGIPPKSRFGNKMTTAIFWLLYGKKVRDTQTGLRGIPTEIVAQFIDLNGERFQYEMNRIMDAVHNGIEVEEIGIQTIYFDNNNETHFDPVKDSLQIMGQLFGTFFKYLFSSISSFIVDIFVFTLLVVLLEDVPASTRILVSTIIARVISSTVHFSMNKTIVFGNKSKDKSMMVKYFSLVVIQMFVSWVLVTFLYKNANWNETISKVIVDSLLFLVSFRNQKFFIFHKQ